jgi:hypothetical protein
MVESGGNPARIVAASALLILAPRQTMVARLRQKRLRLYSNNARRPEEPPIMPPISGDVETNANRINAYAEHSFTVAVPFTDCQTVSRKFSAMLG